MMKFVIAIAASLTFLSSAAANPYDYRVIRVLDGDTVEFDAPFLPKELKQVLKLRIEGVDTPENVSRYVPSVEKMKKEFGLTNHVALDVAIRKTESWLRSRPM